MIAIYGLFDGNRCLYVGATDFSASSGRTSSRPWKHFSQHNNNQSNNNMTTRELKNTLRSGPYAWPGGYPLFFTTSDGAALSFDAVREQFRSVIYSMRHGINDGWRVVAVDVNWEDTSLYCDHTGKLIESAYGEVEA